MRWSSGKAEGWVACCSGEGVVDPQESYFSYNPYTTSTTLLQTTGLLTQDSRHSSLCFASGSSSIQKQGPLLWFKYLWCYCSFLERKTNKFDDLKCQILSLLLKPELKHCTICPDISDKMLLLEIALSGKLLPSCLSVAQYLCLSKMKSNYAFFLSLYKFTPNIENQWNKL